MTKYKLVDLENKDVVCTSNDLRDIRRAARDYDEGCEGDWFPILYELNDQGKYEESSTPWSY